MILIVVTFIVAIKLLCRIAILFFILLVFTEILENLILSIYS